MQQAYILGVTGHRDIHPQAFQEVKEKTGAWLDDLLFKKPNKQIIVLSPLASGADQLVAELSLERGLALHVTLPFPLERYIEDFKSDKEREQFYSLYEQAVHAYVPELIQGKKNDASCYFAVGAHVAQHSHLLFALWNGAKSPEKVGGTAHIVRCQLQGFPDEFTSPSALSHRETVWIRTQRSGDSSLSPKGIHLTNDRYIIIGKDDNNG
ncbi:hypothetical protein [Metabacillus bambusae]|uniref:Uncharacterized protein n=1 Tax=Metabacillus bambusae TaxID=2795218 RepID=A0ABS3N157_9BACI|nr:hypothetical protein [Metabacillus bambusae]MBO1511811.1 hypothetical protein [Metabacillus bambusae]